MEDKEDYIHFALQTFSSGLTVFGTSIVILHFLRNYSKKLPHQTLIQLIFNSGLLGVSNFTYHFIRVVIQGTILDENSPTSILLFCTRLIYFFRILTQFFVISCCCWTFCIALSLLFSFKKAQSSFRDATLLIIFHIISNVLPFIDATFWGIFYQLDISSNGSTGNLDPNLQNIFLVIYYIEHILILAFGFIFNSILLIIILKHIRDSNRKIKELTMLKNNSFKEESYAAFTLSLYIIPFLICSSWQIFGYFILSLINISEQDIFLEIFKVIVYPYSFFFPLQGLLNCLVFYFNKRKFGMYLKKLFCLEINQEEEERGSGSVKDKIQAYSTLSNESKNKYGSLSKQEFEELKKKLKETENRLEEELKKNEILSSDLNDMKQKNSSLEFNLNLEEKKSSFMKISIRVLEKKVERFERGTKKKVYSTEQEIHIADIQRAFRRKLQTQQFIDIVPRFQKSDISKKLKERNQIIREFVKTEQSYVNGLSELKKYYIDPLRHNLMDTKVKKKKMTENDMNTIFGNAEHILTVHQVFLVGLNLRLSEWPMCNIEYISYVNSYDDAVDRLREIRKSSNDFEKLCQAMKKKTTGNLDLQSLIILPVQRLPRYILLLRELIKNTDKSHVDYQNLISAKLKIEQVTKEINEKKRQHEHGQLVKRVSKDLDIVDLDIEKRTFIHEDLVNLTIQIVGQKKPEYEKRQFLIFLFEDLLIFFKVKGSGSVMNNLNNLNIFKKSSSTSSLTKNESESNLTQNVPNYSNIKYVYDDEHEVFVKYYSHYNLKTGNCIVFEHGTTDTTLKMEKIELSCMSDNGKTTIQYILEFPGNGFDGKLDAWYAELIHYIDQATNKIIE
eukprot:gene10376-2905_t